MDTHYPYKSTTGTYRKLANRVIKYLHHRNQSELASRCTAHAKEASDHSSGQRLTSHAASFDLDKLHRARAA